MYSSRKIMSYHFSNGQSLNQIVQALKIPHTNRITANNTIYHSDRGLQYLSKRNLRITSFNLP